MRDKPRAGTAKSYRYIFVGWFPSMVWFFSGNLGFWLFMTRIHRLLAHTFLTEVVTIAT